MTPLDILHLKYGKDIAEQIINSYLEIESNYFFNHWKSSELDSGHFVEAVRRLLEYELFGNSTPLNKSLAPFSDKVLLNYQNAQQKDESYRILIPRVLKAIYNLRNKRGVAHIGKVSANKMDATYILYSVKWILAELVRLNTQLSVAESQKLIDQIVDRNLEILWKTESHTRILDNTLTTKQKILVFLLDKSPMNENELRNNIEYQNQSRFKTILKELHRTRMIEYSDPTIIEISPLGQREAERILLTKQD